MSLEETSKLLTESRQVTEDSGNTFNLPNKGHSRNGSYALIIYVRFYYHCGAFVYILMHDITHLGENNINN